MINMKIYTIKGNLASCTGVIATKAEINSAISKGVLEGDRIDILTGESLGTITYNAKRVLYGLLESETTSQTASQPLEKVDALQPTSMFGLEEVDNAQPTYPEENIVHKPTYSKEVWDSLPDDKELYFAITSYEEPYFIREWQTFIPGWKTTHRCISFFCNNDDLLLLYNVDLKEFLYVNAKGEDFIDISIDGVFSVGFVDTNLNDFASIPPCYRYGFITFKYDINKILQVFPNQEASHIDATQPGFVEKLEEYLPNSFNLNIGNNYKYIVETNPETAKDYTEYIRKHADETRVYDYNFFAFCFEDAAKKNHLSYKMEMIPAGENMMCKLYDIE